MSVLIALPKGRLLEEVQNLFKKIDIEFDTDSRKLIIDTSFTFLTEIKLLRELRLNLRLKIKIKYFIK